MKYKIKPDMDYIVCRAIGIEDLIKLVKNFMSNGYSCQGGIFKDGELYLQAMIKQP